MKRTGFFKRTAAAFVAAAVAAGSLSSCGDVDRYPMSAGDVNVNPGVYINFVLGELSDQMYALYYSGIELESAEDCFSQNIEGVAFADVVKENALESTMQFMAINKKFDEFGLTLSEEDEAEIQESVDYAWSSNGDMLEYLGVSKDSYKQVAASNYKKDALFEYYFGENGIQAVSDAEAQSYVNENFIRVKMVTYPKSMSQDAAEKEKENKEIEERFQHYLEEAEGMSFEEFDKIIDEHNAYLDELQAEAEAEADEDEELDGEEGGIDDTEDSAADDTADEEEGTADTDEDAEDSAADDEDIPEEDEEIGFDDDEDFLIDDEEDDPYKNEAIINASQAIDTASATYSEGYGRMVASMKAQPIGKAAIYSEHDSYYVIYMTADVSERTDYVQDNKAELVEEMKAGEFESMLAQWVEQLGVTVNDKALKKYGVRTLFDRQNEYYSKQGDV